MSYRSLIMGWMSAHVRLIDEKVTGDVEREGALRRVGVIVGSDGDPPLRTVVLEQEILVVADVLG